MSSKQSSLSTQQWLNIIILAISFLFLVFILLGKTMNQSNNTSSSDSDISMLDRQLVAIDFGEVQLKKDNEHWASNQPSLLNQQAELIATNWQNLLNSQGEKTAEKFPQGKTVLVFLSNHDEPLVAKLLQTKTELVISLQSLNLVFHLPSGAFPRFYPN